MEGWKSQVIFMRYLSDPNNLVLTKVKFRLILSFTYESLS